MTKNKDNKRKAAGKAARAFFAGAALCALLGTALFSCSLFSADSGHSDFGSITMAMPSAEQINAARGGSVSRAVTSSGAFDDDAVTAFKVRTKNAATGDENVQTVEPGSTVRISPLAPGFWSVTVFGNTSADQTVYYGKTQNILVSAGQNTSATVVINPVEPNTPLLISLQAAPNLPVQGRANVTGAYVSFDADGQTSSAYYDFSNADAVKQPQAANKIIVPVPAFLEPETSASTNVWLFGSNGAALWSGTVSGDVKSDGTLEGELSFMDTSLVGTQIAGAVSPADYAKVESSLATQMESESALSYSFDTRAAGAASAGDSKAYSDLKIKALVSDACGNVPVLAECSGAAWAAVIPFKHKYVEPTVTMPDQKIPLGATRTLSAVVTPKDSKEYSVCKAAQSYDAYGLKLYSIQAKDTGSTVSASSYAAPASPVSSEFTEPDKVKATSAAASDGYTWQVTVTKSAWAYFEGDDSQTEKTFSGTFDATGSAWTITPAEVSVEKGAAFTLTLKCADATEADAKSVATVTLAAGSSSKDFAPTASGTSLAVKAENFATWTGAKNVTVSVEGVDVGTVKVTATASGGGGGGNVPPDFVFVQGATISGKIGDGTGANASSVFIDNRTIEIPDMYVCAHEVTQSEYEQYCKYSGSTPSASYGLGDDYPVYYVCYLDAIIYCNLRSAAEGLDPVYYAVIDGPSNELSLDYTKGTKSYKVDDWISLYPNYGVTKDDSEKYSAYSSYSQTNRPISYPNRGITMDKTRNGYRLLTEAEWEYCARGGNGLTGTQTYYSGSDTLNAVAWNYGNSKDTTDNKYKSHIVMQLDPNGLGIFDMTGNVEEWVYGWVGDDAITATTPETGYVFNSSYTSSNTAKGGYWNWSDSSCYLNRHGSYNTYSGYEVGFRICRNKETRSLSGFKGIWSISPPARQTAAKNTGIYKFFFQNNTASSSDYASFDPSKLIIKYDGTNHSFDSATMTLDKQADGVLLQMTNPNQNTGYLWYTFYYDGVEIGYVNTETTN